MVKFDFNKTPITQIADYIILAAAKMNASDIHFDPREDGTTVRIRVDGDLENYTHIPKEYERNLATRLKLLANMNITETRLPQDGAIKGNFGGTYLDMRVSCLPLNEGEKIVIRILDYSRSLEGLDALGFNDKNLKKLKRMIKVPNGIILITGATGSGKSTTVYSILQTLNKEHTNIITVEDPIEMNIEGLNQVQVNSEIGMTFAAALRSILRQDPNIILIGEIRDSETAQIAVRASITGHLVLSTIHTNNALSTVERLLDMNVERYLLSSALTGIISQRLAKKICKKCRIERPTTEYEKKLVQTYLHKDMDKVYDINPKGCNDCHNGYNGRIAIQEVLELDDDIRNALNNENLKREDLRELVYTENVITMLQDALSKVVEGITTFDEVYRIIEIDDSDSIFQNLNNLENISNPEKDKKEGQIKTKKSKKSNIKLVVPSFSEEKETTVPPTTEVKDNPVKTTNIPPATQNNQQVSPPQAITNAINAVPPANQIVTNQPIPIAAKTLNQTKSQIIDTNGKVINTINQTAQSPTLKNTLPPTPIITNQNTKPPTPIVTKQNSNPTVPIASTSIPTPQTTKPLTPIATNQNTKIPTPAPAEKQEITPQINIPILNKNNT